ncbi:hypothetical protein [Glacieibacterium sp.]|uniref:hypothetical protein n=1 Tax=Glacieibacterium sp. TaxID=2860237 RepID=UPI003AFF9FA2
MPPFEVLLAAMRDELDALDSDDAVRIEAATALKLAALGTTVAPTPDELHAAQALNALASARTSTLIAGVTRRLAALATAAGRPAALTYGRNGRTSL